MRCALQAVPWARPGSPYALDFEDVAAWLAYRWPRRPSAGLLRIVWDSGGQIVARVVAEQLDDQRLDGLVAIGVDEVHIAAAKHLTRSSTTSPARLCAAHQAALSADAQA